MDNKVDCLERAVYLRALHELDEQVQEVTQTDEVDDLLREASEIALGIDQREGIDTEDGVLENIFHRFRAATESPISYYPHVELAEGRVVYPQSLEGARAAGSGADSWKTLLDELDLASCSVTALARILEIAASYRPAKHLPDVSLYDHTKLTAAIASCLQMYGAEHADMDFSRIRKEETFLLVSGDLSGVQKFIYTIPSAGALKSLRGRSFYLDILLEQAADEILSHAGVSRSCLLYTGGGHFYLLLPNTEPCQSLLKAFAASINDWFLAHVGMRLYLAMAWTPCTSEAFMGIAPGGAGEPFRKVSRQLSKEKLQRYTPEQLAQLFNASSPIHHRADPQRECSICHISSSHLAPYHEASPETLACPSCRGLYRIGERMLRFDAFLITTTPAEDAVPIPGFERELFLRAVDSSVVSADRSNVVRLYVKNQCFSHHPKAVYLWLADYISRNADGSVLEFSDLAALSGGSEEAHSIRRLGVLRADVDNLGAAFIAGFPEKYATLSRTGALSRSLSLFFKCYLPMICAGKLAMPGAKNTKRFSLFSAEKEAARHVHVIYAGGDDLFLVGAWDDLVEAAVDFRRAFSQFTDGKLSFSAGIGFFPAKCPVSVLAEKTGQLEDVAKDNPGKDSIALFGTSTEVQSVSRIASEPERFSWTQFVDCVIGEKLAFLQRMFAYTEEEAAAAPQKLRIGKGKLYQIMSLLDDAGEDGNINLARFAYVLARMESKNTQPEKRPTYQTVRRTLYDWYQDATARKELHAAIEFMVYHLRDKEVF